ncbi:MAG: glycosyl transferase family protein [Candidatus Gottesmanbacteria bacterium GW2011_GWA2_43_14]|uniref:Glycosyl transferase family protein n=1 Tax=Candidatus Gottesmanbacteria bacterium GW2011_GWA2_43_14 TaxID=1618443 RepID=A0A0G1DDP5_9BACT|nr:MAG: glycosyl transferase family protein [Candidatus Gottesmanbacteria bacterium GW2011_GWA2_43_14]
MPEREIWSEWRSINRLPVNPLHPDRVLIYEKNAVNIFKHNVSKGGVGPQAAILIPAFNEQMYLPRALIGINATLDQIDPDNMQIQVTVVDNKSCDNTKLIAEIFGAIVIDEKVKGIGNARQTGLESLPSSVEYVFMTDADSLVNFKWAERHFQSLATENTVATLGDVRYLPENQSIKNELLLRIYSLIANGVHRYLNAMGSSTAVGQNMGLNKLAALEVEGFKRDFIRGSDTLLLIALSELGEISYINGNCVYSSGRRIINNGILKHGFTKLMHNFRRYIDKKVPLDTENRDIR